MTEQKMTAELAIHLYRSAFVQMVERSCIPEPQILPQRPPPFPLTPPKTPTQQSADHDDNGN